MKHHFMRFADEDAAKLALAAYRRSGAWDTSRVIPNQRVVLARAVWDETDQDNPVIVSPEVRLPGYFVTVSLSALDTDLRDLPNNACRLIGDSVTGELVYVAPDLDTGLLTTAIIEPVPAGAPYNFGG